MRTPTPCVLPTEPATRELLAASGMSPRMLRTYLSAGQLVRVRQGVYVAASAVPPDAREAHLLRAHAEQVVHPGSVLSHESAGAHWDLPHPGALRWHDLPPAITVSGEGARSRHGDAVHHRATLPLGQVTRDEAGYLVTTAARTGVDLAAGLDLPQALVLCDAAARRIVEQLVPSPRRQDYGSPRLAATARRLIEDAASAHGRAGLGPTVELTDPARVSVPESLTSGHLHLAGLPAPALQHRVASRIGWLYPDVYWPEANLIGECDGAVKYATAQGYVDEKEREQVLRDLGYRMVRWLAKEIMFTPWVVVERIARALGL